MQHPEKIMIQNGVALATVLEATRTGAYKNEKKLRKLWCMKEQYHDTYASISKVMKELLTFAHEKEGKDYDPLLPILLEVAEVPEINATSRQAITEHQYQEMREIVQLGVEENLLSSMYVPQPGVETWIGETSEAFRQILLKSEVLCQNRVRLEEFDDIVTGTLVAIRILLLGAGEIFRNQDVEYQASLVAWVLRRIETMTGFTLIRSLLSDPELLARLEQPSIGSVTGKTIRPEYMSARSDLAALKQYVTYIAKVAGNADDIADTLIDAKQIPELAEQFARSPFSREESENKVPRSLPWGALTIGRRIPGESQAFLYSVNGMAHMTAMGFVDAKSRGTIMASQRNDNQGDIEARARVVHLDDDLKPYAHPTVDRYSPPVQDDKEFDAAREKLLSVDRYGQSELLELWERFPGCFHALKDHGPLFIARDVDGDTIVCQSSAEEIMRQYIDGRKGSDEDTAKVMQDYELSSKDPWVSYRVPNKPVSEGNSVPTSIDDRDHWRSLIRHRVGSAIPSLDWILNHLRKFGRIRQVSGHGSHEHIILERGSRDYVHNTWKKIRGSESVHFGLLYEYLMAFDISEKEFYEMCLKE